MLLTAGVPVHTVSARLGHASPMMTLSVYARRKQWPLEDVTVTLSHSKVHAADCAACEQSATRLDRIDRAIELRGPLSDEQRARLLEIADHCPVHRTLTSKIEIRTLLVDAAR